MKERFTQLQAKVRQLFSRQNDTHTRRRRPVRDWFIILGCTAALSVGFAAVGVYRTFSSRVNMQTDNALIMRALPLDQSELAQVLQRYRERAKDFEQKRATTSDVPDPGTVHLHTAPEHSTSSSAPVTEETPTVEG